MSEEEIAKFIADTETTLKHAQQQRREIEVIQLRQDMVGPKNDVQILDEEEEAFLLAHQQEEEDPDEALFK